MGDILRNVRANISSDSWKDLFSWHSKTRDPPAAAQIFDLPGKCSKGISILGADNRTSNIFLICANLRYLWWIPINWWVTRAALVTSPRCKLVRGNCSVARCQNLSIVSHTCALFRFLFFALYSPTEKERERDFLFPSSFYNWCFLSRVFAWCLQ